MIGLGTFVFAYLISYVSTVLLLRVRLKGVFVDVPNERSSHDVVKPRFGGIAIVTAFTLGLTVLLLARTDMNRFLPLLLGGVFIFGVGLLDDWRSLPVWVRLAAQLTAALILVGTGNIVHHIYLPLVGTIELSVLAIPFTIIFVLASINFYNFVDGIDGLAAGSAFIVACFLALIAFMLGHTGFALVCLVVAGSSAGFLQFNFPPSKLFMGDSGSTFLGFFFSFIAIAGNRLTPEIPFFVTVLLLSSLFLDAGLTLLGRAFRGEKIFKPHHMHYYQRLLSLGLNHKQVTVLEYGLTVLLGISALVFFKAGEFFPVFLTLCWLAIFTSLILKIRSLERGDKLFFERRTLLVIGSDVVLIALAYFAAYFIRVNFQFTEDEGPAVIKAFPIVLVVRSACFYWYGLYRGVWKYTSTPDVVRIIKAVTAGSVIILTLLVFFYRFVAFPRSMFIIEFFLLIIALGGSRFASRLFHEFGKEATSGLVKRVAIIGAGDYGERLLREFRSTKGKTVSVVCFVDDDRDKEGLTLQGVPITGPISQLEDICKRFNVESVAIGIKAVPEAKLRAIVRATGEANVVIEYQDGSYATDSGPAVLLFDRLNKGLDRVLPTRLSESAAAYYQGKRVLVTHGGEILGPGLVGELARRGAKVAVHVTSRWDIERFAGIDGGGIDFFIANIDREIDASRLFDDARPDVVIHTIPLGAQGVTNGSDYIWRRTVRTCSALCRVIPKHGIGSIAFVLFHDGVGPSSRRNGLGAVCEALVLNDTDIRTAAPKVIRLPSVLTGDELKRIGASLQNRQREQSGRFELTELEATALVLNTTAIHKGRASVIPEEDRPFGRDEIAALLGHGVALVSCAGSTEERDPCRHGLVLPSETPRPSAVPGAVELVSPLYPASESLARIVTDCSASLPGHALDRNLDAVAEELAAGRLRTSAE
jgi:UDP-GlcNAc:undecaprenyl-phosphate GlcNAc-1-phosphate transferase